MIRGMDIVLFMLTTVFFMRTTATLISSLPTMKVAVKCLRTFINIILDQYEKNWTNSYMMGLAIAYLTDKEKSW